MVNLAQAVEGLVTKATTTAEPRSLRGSVEAVLSAFDAASERARSGAVRSIGNALRASEDYGVQVLCLALGALVESGASPEIAWPAIADDLGDLLDDATSFATAAIKRAKDDNLETALASVGASLAKKRPREAAAWKAMPARCLTAVACLTRSKKVRARARKNPSLQASSWALSNLVAEVGYLHHALHIVDDEKLLVLAPELELGWRVVIDAMPSNVELYLLLADALVRERRRNRVPGTRPDPAVVATIRGGAPSKRSPSVKLPFRLTAATLLNDGDAPFTPRRLGAHLVPVEGIPADIPLAGRERVVLLHARPWPHSVPVAASFESLRPNVEILKELSQIEVARALHRVKKVVRAQTNTADS